MKLYYYPASSSSRKVRVTAALLGIRLEEQLVDLPAGEHKKPEYLRINPNGLVPTLLDGNRVLWESNAIMQYLADLKPENSLLPREPMARADITRWQCWEQAHWVPALVIVIRENVFKPLWGQSPDSSEIKRGEEAIHKVAPVLDAHLKERSYLVGDHLTLADISVAAILMYDSKARLPLGDYRHVQRWYGRVTQVDAWKATEPPENRAA
jgi:glutathione S-transferase